MAHYVLSHIIYITCFPVSLRCDYILYVTYLFRLPIHHCTDTGAQPQISQITHVQIKAPRKTMTRVKFQRYVY